MQSLLPLGFSTAIWQPELSLKESLTMLRERGVVAVELGHRSAFPETDEWESVTSEDLSDFTYISLHAPDIAYGHNDETTLVFQKIIHLQALCNLDLVVFHPDALEDASIFHKAKFPFAFENMDWRQPSHKNVEDLDKLFMQIPGARMVLNLARVYTNDQTMQLAHEFYSQFGDRIVQIRLSGCKDDVYQSLAQTEQREIIAANESLGTQIVVEGRIDRRGLEKEREYIEGVLYSLQQTTEL